MEHSSTPLSALWKEAIESFTTEADLSEQETASLGLFHSPEQLLDVVGYGHSGRSRGLVRQRLKAQKTVTAVLNIFGALDLALNLAQGAFPALCVFSGAIKLLLKALKGLWNVYEVIQEQFAAIQSFLTRADINLQTRSVRAGLDSVVVQVLRQMLHICAVAIRYAKTGSFRRTAGNLLKALGPNDDLTCAVSELNNLLKNETQIIATQINHTVSHIADTMAASVQINTEVRAQTSETAEIARRQIGILTQVHRRVSRVQNGQTQTAARVDRLAATMNRMEASSQASWEETNERLDSVISSMHESRWDDETARLRAWLEPVESYEDDFERNYSLHQSGTCEWAFNPSDSTGRTIIQWFDGSDDDHKIVWLTGNPAQGKSVFSAYLIQRCQDIKGRCLYFFCRHDDEAKRSVKKALKTIAFSLSQYEDRIRERYFAQMKQGISLGNIISAAVLAEKLFNAPASILSQPLHCVIDGLDELALADRRDLAKVLPTITALNIRILIISRPDRELEDAFEEKQARVQIICMDQNHTSRDIRSVVTERVGRKLSALPEGSKKTIIDTITRKSGGLFLWAKLAVDIICRKRLEKAIFEALNNLPLESQMKGLYSVIVARISAECSDEDERSLAKALLTWTFCSIRPLLLSELECALYLRFGTINGLRKNVRDLSGSLIQIGEDKQVTVVHATVKEFFMSEDAGEFRVSEPISHHYVAEACLDYILEKLPEFLHAHEDSSPEPLRLRDKYPFIEYATQYLFNHLQQCQLSDCLKDRIIEFLRGRRALTWIEALATFELTKLLSFAGDVVERSGIDERVKTYGSDLRRIALLIDEALITFPRSVHTSLSSTFPDSCAIAREVRNELVIFTKPSFVEWPAAKAARRRSDVWTMGMKSAIAFSPCGDYLIFGQMPESASPIDLTVYETQTYQRVSKIPPFAFNPSVLNKNVLPLGNKFAFFQIRFDASQNVRIVIAFAVGRVILEGKIFSRCIMAEYFSQSTLQSGAWQQKPFDVPLTRGTPAVRVAMNPRGRQIVAWFDRILHLWRSIGSGSLTFDIRYEVLSSDFILVNQDVFAICVTKESVQIYDVGARRLMSDLPYRCTFPVDKAFIDPAGRTALLVSGRRSTRQHSLLQLHIESRRNISLSVEQYLDPGIQHYSGRFGRSAWEYEIWENIKRRTLVARGESAPSQIYPHPFKMESLLQPSISQYAFVVFDDLPSTSIAIAVQHEPTQPVRQESSVDLYFAVLEKAEARDRFCRHPNNCRLSLCGMFFAVLGCDRMYHSPDCVDCVTKPSRLAVINRSSTRPSLRWPLEEGDIDGGGRIDVSFDQFSRLVVFTDHTPGFSVHVVDPFTEFTLRYLGLLRCPDMAIPPLVHTRSHSEMYFACYSRRMPLEIWRWESNPSKESLHLYRELDGVCIIAAVLVSSVLVFISDMGWVGTVPLLDQNARVVNHFLLANEIITPLKDGGKMTCDVDGLVTVDASDGQCWQFTVYSLCQYLQGFE